MPPFIRMMQSKQCDSASFRRTVYFLNDLVKTVKEHIRSYLPDILRSMEPFWDTNQFEILIFIRVCSSCFHSEFKLYLVYVMPRMLSILSESAPEKRRAATEIVHCLHCIVPSLDNYLNVVFPGLMRFIENNEHVEASEREGVKCLKRIVNELDVSLYTSQIIMPLLRVLSKDYCCVTDDIMDVICSVMCQKQQEAYIYLSAINKVVSEKNINYPDFQKISNILYRGGVLAPRDYSFDQKDDSVVHPEEPVVPRHHNGDMTALQTLWRQAVNLTTKDEWIEWSRRFTITLIKESPDFSIRSCHALAQTSQIFANELFNAAFNSLWNELPAAYRADLASCFKQAFNSKQPVPPEITMKILSLAEFMEHDEEIVLQMSKDIVLPLDIGILGDLAMNNNAYAKALHYKEMEYETTPDSCIETLIQINNQLHYPDAAVGVLHYSQKYYEDITVMDELYEKLGRWEEALEAYEKKQWNRPLETELTMGRIRCLNALGESELVLRVIQRAEDKLGDCGQAETAAVYGAKAAFDLGDWELLRMFITSASAYSTEISYYQVALYIHDREYEKAEKLISETRNAISRTLAPIISEGYDRIYSHVIQLEELKELEEICSLRKNYAPESPDYFPAASHLVMIFNKRLDGVQRDVSVWHELLSLRKLFVEQKNPSSLEPKRSYELEPLNEDDRSSYDALCSYHHWLKFISLARKSNRPALALRTLESLGINIKSYPRLGANPNDENDAYAEVRYAYHKFLYDQGLTKEAIQRLRKLVDEDSSKGSNLRYQSVDQDEQMTVRVRMRLRLAQWVLDENHRSLSHQVVRDIATIINECSEFNKDHKAYHEIAMLHMTCAEYYNRFTTQEAYAEVTDHLKGAIGSFFDAISLSKDKNSSLVLQDILRLITLWFTYGDREKVINAINSGFNIISIDTWLYVIPQLVARIHIKESGAKRLLINLLVQLTKAHPQALVYPLTRSTRSETKSRQRAALEVLSHLRRDNSVLVNEADLVSSELIRVAVLWTEKWRRGIEEASTQYYEFRNVHKMLLIFDDLYRTIGVPSEVGLNRGREE